MGLYTDLTLKLVATLTGTLDLAPSNVPLDSTTRMQLASGVTANKADLMFSDRRTLGPSATEDLDLAGTLPDGLGGVAVFARVKIILIKALAANANNVNVTRVATTGFPLFLADGDGLSVRPGGFVCVAAPDAVAYPVTALTDDTLTFTNSAGSTSVTYDVIIIGASA